ncbi:MAG: FHA domain-containing protein [Byssovorax sp.]
MICDVCGRDNADTLTFCQDCGRRLRAQRVVPPTPPSGLPKVELPAAAPAPAPVRETPVPPGPPSQRRGSRPEAPAFSFGQGPVEPVPVLCGACHSSNPPSYRFCVTCGASLKAEMASPAAIGAAPASRSTDRLGAAMPIDAAPAAPPAPEPRPVEAARPVEPRRVEVAPLPEPRRVERLDDPARREEPPVEARRPEGPRPASSPAMPAQAAVSGGDQIVGAPVVEIAVSKAAPIKHVTCARCHGHCVAGTRFCKFCGAPLDEAPAPRQVSAEPPPQKAAPVAAAAAVPEAARPERRIPVAPQTEEPPRAVRGGAPAIEPGRRAEISVLAGSPVPPEVGPPAMGRPARELPRHAESRPRAPGRLVVIVEDGSEGRSFSLAEGQLDIGRTDGDILLEDDHYVSPRHARLRLVEGRWILRDLDSTNHVYVRLRKPHPLREGDLLLLGLEVLQFQTVSDGERGLGHAIQHGTLLFGSPATPRRARLCQRTVEGVIRDVYHLFRDETVIGRETGDIVFTADPFLSRRHASIRRNPVTGEFSLVDLDSSNGTYIAIQGEVGLSNGDFLRIGQHLFRVDLG